MAKKQVKAVAVQGAVKEKETLLPIAVKPTSAVLTKEVLENVFKSEAFEGEGVSVTSTYMKKEDWEELEGVEVKILFNGETTTIVDEDTAKISEAALFYSDYADGKSVVRYKGAQSMLAGGLKDGGKGLYKVIYLGEKKRSGKSGTFMNFDIQKISSIN